MKLRTKEGQKTITLPCECGRKYRRSLPKLIHRVASGESISLMCDCGKITRIVFDMNG